MTRTLLRLAALVVVVGATPGCFLFGLSHRIDRDLLEQIPNEEKLLLFDAENGVYIAKDEIQDARRAVEDAEHALERAERYDDVIQTRKESGAAIDTPQVINALSEWNAARIELRQAEVAYREQQVSTAESRLWASRARYERAKARLVKDFDPEEGADIDVVDFDEQVKDLEADEQEEQKALDELEKQMQLARGKYNQLSVRLQKMSGGAYGGPWADLAD